MIRCSTHLNRQPEVPQRPPRTINVARWICELLNRSQRSWASKIRKPGQAIRLFLKQFTAPPVGLLLAGSARPFITLWQEKRERYLIAPANSPIGPFRQGYQGIERLAGFIYFSALDQRGVNPNRELLDYTPPQPQAVNLPAPIKPLVVAEDTQLEADGVIIGSGAGGGVVAGELALAGKSVIVLEKG